MDNVLIDDRRIHVDFSQSVAKVKWKGKGKAADPPKPDKSDGRPQYVLKDTSRKSDKKYELVFEEEGDQPATDVEIVKEKKKDKKSKKKKKKKKKQKKHKKKSSSDDESDQSADSEKPTKIQKNSSKSKHDSNSGSSERHRKSSPSPDRLKSKSSSKGGSIRNAHWSRSPISRGSNRRDHSPDHKRNRDYDKTSSKDKDRKISSKHSRDKY